MRKFLEILLVIVTLVVVLCGCGKKNENVEDIYMKVLKDEIKFVYEDGNEMLFSEFVTDDLKDVKVSYAVCDFDRDNQNEMIINIRDTFYLILNYEDGTVYGFMDVYRGIEGLRVDGTYLGSGGADAHGMYRTTFNKTKRTDIVLARSDWGKYQIDEKSVSKEEYDKFYEKEYASKELVKFVVYDEHYNK